MQSLIHHQFSAEKYEKMIRYAFNKAGYNESYSNEEFETPAVYSFGTGTSLSDCLSCMALGKQETGFGRCGHCGNTFCSACSSWHFILYKFRYHYIEPEVDQFKNL